ncbi:MAG TPA: type IIL restriction-modification enzyme MmeI, partial [Thermomicrobiales bacterium]|nr:type IIL restriction-modification enzyme MmeI [Thermomicrobiales bacterium]
MDPVAFQTKWRTASANLKERTASQSHFNDLCALVGVQNPIEADPVGDTYTFERGAQKAGGGDGWADVWYKGRFAWEYKGIGRDLEAAYVQLLKYKDALENPPLLVVCDLDRIEIRTNFTNTSQQTHVITIDQLTEPGALATLRQVWTNPEAFHPGVTREEVTAEAAARFGQIALGLHRRGIAPERAAHVLMQLLFCLFAEDIGLLPDSIFSKMLDLGVRYPARFQIEATRLLEAMNTGDFVAYEKIPHINGGLFRHVDVPELTEPEIRILREAATLDWSAIEPAIFGTLFERSLDPAKRSQLGAHYTGRTDIERVVDPVVMAPLRRRWDEVRSEINALPEKIREEEQRRKKATSPQARGAVTKSLHEIQSTFNTAIEAFLDELRQVRVLDPACGSGNFLYVALDRLLNLEKEVMLYRA